MIYLNSLIDHNNTVSLFFFSDRKEMVEFGAKYGLTCKQVKTQIVNTRRKRMMEKKHMRNLLVID